MSDSNRIVRRYAKESTFNTIPTSPTLTEIRCINEDFNGALSFTESPEARSDAQIVDGTPTGITGGGTLLCAYAYLAQDWAIVSALRGDAFSGDSATATDNGGTIQLAISSSAVVSSGATGYDWVANGFEQGRWVRLQGWTTNAGTIYAKIGSGVTTSSLPLEGVSLANEASGPTNCTVTLGEEVTNGTTLDSYFIQRQYEDLSNKYRRFTGWTLNGLDMEINAADIIRISFPTLGADEQGAASAPASSTPADNPGASSQIINTTSSIPQLYFGGVSLDVRTLRLTVDNGSQPRERVAYFGPTSVRGGRCRVTLNAELYNDANSLAEMDKARANTASDVYLAITDADGNGMVWDFPNVKYRTASASPSGPDSDTFVRLDGQAFRDSTEGITVRYVRWPA